MNTIWRKTRLKIKLIFLGLFIILTFSSLTFFYFIPETKRIITDRKKEKIRDLTYIAYSMIDRHYKLSAMGQISEAEAKSKASYFLKNLNFGNEKENTFFLFDSNGVLLSDPQHVADEGQIILNQTNNIGIFIYKEMIDRALKQNESFYEYIHDDKYDENTEVLKYSFVKHYKPWDWIIGTSVYVYDIEEEVMNFYLKYSFATIIIILFSTIILIWFANAFTKPIKKLNSSLKNADLNTELTTVLKDEIGDMAQLFNDFTKKIKNIIIEIRLSSDHLAVSSEEMSTAALSFSDSATDQSESTQEIINTVKRITFEMDNVNKEIETEFESLEELVSNMKDLSELINIVAEQTEHTVLNIGHINKNAIDGGKYLQIMKNSIEKVSKSSTEMHNIVSIINDISEQINLLSLNASIEAARAGNSGKGFAIVADEISNLADKTANSIKNIDTMINENGKEIENASKQVNLTVYGMDSIIDGVNSIKTMIESISTKMQKQVGTKEAITSDIDEIKQRSSSIRMTTKVQKIAVNEINDLILSISGSISNIMSGSKELSAGSREVAGMAEKLNKHVEIFNIDEMENK